MYQELAGKRFWAELTGDEDFYIKIIGYMGTMPEKYVADYKESYNRAANRLVREFSNRLLMNVKVLCVEVRRR